jgi:ribose-phosphate pyrophosphokinase
MDRDIDIVLSPDIGAAGRAKEVGDYLGVSYDHLVKTRISGTEVRIAPAHMDCTDKNILIVDDIIATGGTIIAATEQLKEAGARSVTVACTHGVFARNAMERLTGSTIDGVLCCNTIENEVSHISVAPLLAELLRKKRW